MEGEEEKNNALHQRRGEVSICSDIPLFFALNFLFFFAFYPPLRSTGACADDSKLDVDWGARLDQS